MKRPEIGDPCAQGSHCCRFVGEHEGRWYWYSFAFDKKLGTSRVDDNRYIRECKEAEVPKTLLHIYASLVLESSHE